MFPTILSIYSQRTNAHVDARVGALRDDAAARQRQGARRAGGRAYATLVMLRHSVEGSASASQPYATPITWRTARRRERLQGIHRPPFCDYKGFTALPFDITRTGGQSLCRSHGMTLPPFADHKG